jgi:hypothetical protein
MSPILETVSEFATEPARNAILRPQQGSIENASTPYEFLVILQCIYHEKIDIAYLRTALGETNSIATRNKENQVLMSPSLRP